MKGQPKGFWGKLQRDEDGNVREWHPLVDHCADVSACVEALLQRTILRRRLAALSCLTDLSEQQIQRLSVLAALHDMGKYSIGFQNKGVGLRPQCGHLSEALGLFADRRFCQPIADALAYSEIREWAEDIDGLIIATISHHGRPAPLGKQVEAESWGPSRGLDPFAGIAGLVERTRGWFPLAWQSGADRLPSDPPFQHAWAGLVTLADWLGSDCDRFFPFSEEGDGDRMRGSRDRAVEALTRLGLDPDRARASLGKEPPGFERIAPTKMPRPAQMTMLAMRPGDRGSVAILEAETGSGKTEAALAYFARLFHAGLVDGMYFALPTRTAASQIYRRVCEACRHAFPESSRPPVVLAVPGYINVDGAAGMSLSHFTVLWNDDPTERLRYRGWAAEHPKRYLAGAIAVGTVDQVLLSSLVVSHAHMRSSALLRHLLVVDEVHASDAYMTRIMEEVLDHHLLAHGHALLMSATLGASARTRLLGRPRMRHEVLVPAFEEAAGKAYPLISIHRLKHGCQEIPVGTSGNQKKVTVELVAEMESPDRVAGRALTAAQAGARVLVVRNTVAGCLNAQIALESLASEREEQKLLFACRNTCAPHHSRYARTDRQLLDEAIEAAFGQKRSAGGQVAVATQTVEQSLDLDSDLLITDLCPIDVLLQRVGRLHRHERLRTRGFERPRVVVLLPEKDLVEFLLPNGDVRGSNGLGTVYEDLRVLEATVRLLRDRPHMSIPRDNRRLVEGGTHPEVLKTLCEQQGGPWLRHHQRVIGELLGRGRLGSLNVIAREIPFGEEGCLFPSGELSRRIQTRLGEGDRLARFEVPQNSPFSGEADITGLTIPYHLVAPGTPSDTDCGEEVQTQPDGFSFRFGSRCYTYDRLGLRTQIAAKEESDA